MSSKETQEKQREAKKSKQKQWETKSSEEQQRSTKSSNFGGVLGAFRATKAKTSCWYQFCNGSSWRVFGVFSNFSLGFFCYRFLFAFGSFWGVILGSFWAPKSAQVRPSWAQGVFRTHIFWNLNLSGARWICLQSSMLFQMSRFPFLAQKGFFLFFWDSCFSSFIQGV